MDKKYYILGGVLAVLLIIAGILFFSGSKSPSNNPGGNSGGATQLVWWKTFEDPQNVQDLIGDYQTTHKNVNITYVKKDVSTYEQELVDALASGHGPDIFTIHNDWLPKHGDKISPMPATAMSLRTYSQTFVDVASNDFTKDGKIYAMPLATDDLALYYNKDLLNSAGISTPPTTWPELVSDVQKLTKTAAGTFLRSGVAMGTSANVNRAVDILSLLMLQNGTQFYSADQTAATFNQTINDPKNATGSFNPGSIALAFYTQFANPAKTSYTWNSQSDFSLDSFTQGKVAMMINYSYMAPMIKSRAPNLNWGVAAIPQISEDSVKIDFANYWGETVAKSSKQQAAAWDFLNFITQKAELTKYYSKHKQVASRKDMLPDQYSDTEIGVFAESAPNARSVYKRDANVFESVFAKMIDDVVLRSFPVDTAVSNAVQQINLNLRQ